MSTLLDPMNRAKGGTKWKLIAHTVSTFSFVTIYTATNLSNQSISYIDHREFFDVDVGLFPGPLGYLVLTYSSPISIVSNFAFLLSNWSADGLLVGATSN